MMDYPPSCSAWSRVVTSENSRFIVTGRTMSNTFEPIETERFYCEPEEDSMSDERGGYSSGTPVVAPPEEFRDHSSGWSSSHRGSQTSQSPSPTPPRQGRPQSPVSSRRGVRSSSPLRASHSGRATSPPRATWGRSSSPGPLRPSSSHNSLTRRRQDDSTFITSAISHDTITDLYNVPIGSDIYTLPVDTIPRPRPTAHKKKQLREKRRRRYTSTGSEVSEKERKSLGTMGSEEPVHMTLQEVRQFLHNLYSSSDAQHAVKQKEKSQRNSIGYLLKKALCSVFRLKGKSSRQREESRMSAESNKVILLEAPRSLAERALPPLPTTPPPVPTLTSHPQPMHFAASLDRVKDCGWYWGPVSGEAAEKILANEPDGSFIVRDSSDDHYIFSLTFRLNGTVRHVRIEHDQGNFSFGSCTKFKSQTIVDFIETAVEHSRSGRYLFFLHRRPILGPMRVQLLHPVSRFKHIQSLQHLCRFVIVKTVRRDLISELPLPRRLIDYLNSPHYYSEQLADQVESEHQTDQLDSEPPSHSPVHLVSFAPPPPPPNL